MTAFVISILTCAALNCVPATGAVAPIAIAPNVTMCQLRGQQMIPQLMTAKLIKARPGDDHFKVDCVPTNDEKTPTDPLFGVVAPPSHHHFAQPGWGYNQNMFQGLRE